MRSPTWYGCTNEDVGPIMGMLQELSTCNPEVLREVMRRVQIRCTPPQHDPLDLSDNAGLLNRYLFKVPRTVPLRPHAELVAGVTDWPLPVFTFSTIRQADGTVLGDVLYPFSRGAQGRLILPIRAPVAGRSATGYSVLEEFEYLRKYCGFRRRPGWEDETPPDEKMLPRLTDALTHEIGSPGWEPRAPRENAAANIPAPGTALAATAKLAACPSWVWGHMDQRLNRQIADTLRELSRYRLKELREVMRHVDARSAYPRVDADDVVDNAVLLNRYVFNVPRVLAISPSSVDDWDRRPLRAYVIAQPNGKKTVDPLFPLSTDGRGRLFLPQELPCRPIGSHGFSVLKEFDYLRKHYGVRRRPGVVSAGSSSTAARAASPPRKTTTTPTSTSASPWRRARGRKTSASAWTSAAS